MPDYCDDRDYMDRDVRDGPNRGYCRHCGRPVEERESRGRRTWDEGQIEPDERYDVCPVHGELSSGEIVATEEELGEESHG